MGTGNNGNGSIARVTGRAALQTEIELFDRIQNTLYTAVIADALDELGYHEQAMREYLRPLTPGTKFAGWARTISCRDIFYIPPDPYGLEIEAIDSILPGEVVAVATGESKRNAPWGELLSTAATARGARGAVIDGLVRDVNKIQSIGFPVFAAGIKPVDSKGRGLVVDYNFPVMCGGILVNPGDLMVGDYDGVVAIPAALVDETLRLATEKVSKENHSRKELANGAYLSDVYAKYGVL
ncbi:MAG TPA: RraA family protein [Terriglobales bacterium]|nr:RraA family protein [Terriglobales bacterium]